MLLLSALKTAFLPAFNQLLTELDKGIIGDIKEVNEEKKKLKVTSLVMDL